MKHLLVLFLFFLSYGIVAQDNYEIPQFQYQVTPQSPQVASLGEYISQPVDHFSGLPQIGVPIHTVVEGNIQVPISLSYHAGGVKVEAEASDVGLGWSLLSGGMVMREVRGLPDENTNGFISGNQRIIDFLDPAVALPYPVHSGILIDANDGFLDLEADLFSYNFLGHSGSFYFTVDGEIQTLPHKNHKIDYETDNGRIVKWLFTTEDGIQYEFGKQGDEDNYDYVINTTYFSVSPNQSASLSQQGATYPNAWHLTKIVDLNSNRDIILEYENYTILNQRRRNQAIHDSFGYSGIPTGASQPYQYTTFSDSSSEAHRIKKIIADQQEVEFIYSSLDREDYPGNKALEEILVTNSSQIKKIKLNQYYVTSSDLSSEPNLMPEQFRRKRLVLESVDIYGSDNSAEPQTYSFEYDRIDQLPNKLSFAQDYWGVYNGQNSNTQLIPETTIVNASQNIVYFPGANRGANENFASIGLLKKTTFPTKGHVRYTYESNQVNMGMIDEDILDLHQGYETESTSFYNNNSFLNTLTNTYHSNPFTIETLTRVDYEILIDCANLASLSCGYAFSIQGINGTNFNQVITAKTGGVTLAEGEYELVAEIIPSTTGQTLDFTFDANWRVLIQNDFVAGGNRIKKIELYSDENQLIGGKQFSYLTEEGTSSGRTVNFPTFKQVIVNQVLRRQSNPVRSAESMNGNYVGYMRIEEKNLVDNGTSVYNYSMYPNDPSANAPDYIIFPQINNSYLRGRLLSSSIKDVNETLKQKSVNEHHSITTSDGLLQVRSYRLSAKPYHAGLPGSAAPFLEGDYYTMYSGASYLKESNQELHENGRQITTNSEQEYDFSNLNNLHPQESSSILSDGNQIIRKRKRALDYQNYNNTFVQHLVDRHMIATPLEETIYIEEGGQQKAISSQLIHYEQIGDHVLPSAVYRLESSQPLANFQESYTNASGFHQDSRYEQVATFTNYDQYGNIQEVEDRVGIKTTYLWAYNSSRPVAKIDNASLQDIEAVINVTTLANSNDINQIKNIVAQLRNGLQNSFVSGFIYDSNTLQLTEMVDANGITSTYEYDDFQRLSQIKDDDDYVLSKYIYHYRENQ